MTRTATLPVISYRVINDWQNKILFETTSLEDAQDELNRQLSINDGATILIVAVLDY